MTARVVLELLKSYFLKQQKRKGIDKAEAKRTLCKSFFYKEIRENAKRDIDYQRHVAYAKARLILDHSGDAVESRGSEAVVYYEQLIIERKKNGNKRYLDVV